MRRAAVRPGLRGLEGGRGGEHQPVGEPVADDLQPDRQAGAGEARPAR